MGFFLIVLVMIGMALALPFALRSVTEELAEPPVGAVYTVPIAPGAPPAATQSRLHVTLVELDEASLIVTLRVSGHQVCRTACPYADRIVFFSLGTAEEAAEGMPPSDKVDLAAKESVVTTTIMLPVRGNPSRYPFDSYQLWLGLGMARVEPDGTALPISRAEAAGRLFITLQEHLPREHMVPPVAMEPDLVRDLDDPYELQGLVMIGIERPLYARVLAVLLVVLIAAAASYAVFMRPLHDLVMSSGPLVLGVWGIRAILTPGTA